MKSRSQCVLSALRSDRRGAALVEFAIVVPLLLLIALGIIEFGVMARNYFVISEAARAGARSAALGSQTSVVSQRIISTRDSLGLRTTGTTAISLLYRTYNKATGVWSGWVPLGNGATYNSAPCDATYDSQVRADVTYTYPLVTGNFFDPIFGTNGELTMRASSIMTREQTP